MEQQITIEEALRTSLVFEGRVKQVYSEAAKNAKDHIGKRVFSVLEREEQGHIDYLNSKLEELKTSGKITVNHLETEIPMRKEIDKQVRSLQGKMDAKDRGYELEMLQKALAVEMETSAFYQKMAATLTEEGQKMFSRFVEIEEGHVSLVRAEIDAVSGNGFFFDFHEFNMEMG